ncbi:hypothetical protein [Pseudomonas aeruginosa]|uniref:hypothetical protein n=1 Tax=Pseudomonas aeruginosa TaxID=287 RepID=UPI00287F7AAB|nr:hypothetical protein [Pseudomonas aeruginosa]
MKKIMLCAVSVMAISHVFAAESFQLPAAMAGKAPKMEVAAGDQVNLYPQGIYCDSEASMEALKFAYGNSGNVIRPDKAPAGCRGFQVKVVNAQILGQGQSKYPDAGGWLVVKMDALGIEKAWIESYWVKPTRK